MKRLTPLIFLTLITTCDLNWNGDIKLGGKFEYWIQPKMNRLCYMYSNNSCSIMGEGRVEKIGWNDDHILWSSKSDSSLKSIKYWHIDKRVKAEMIQDDTLNLFSKAVLEGPLDSVRFHELASELEIEFNTALYYQKRGGWTK